jgi:hypothetical protein
MLRRFVACATVLACACAPRGTQTPSGSAVDAARGIAATLRDDDPHAGWNILAGSVRDRERYEDFAARWRASRNEREQRATAIETAVREGDQVGARAELELADGPKTTLVRERGGWRLETPLVARIDAASPNEALRLFSRALDDRSVPEILRLLTTSRREDVRRALERFATGLRAHLGDALDVSGDRATLSWHDGEHRYRIILKRESGEWRIDDFNAD